VTWPEVRTIAAARRGHVAEVVRVGEGYVRGLRSASPHVVAQVAPSGAVACCEACGAREPEPDPPGSGGPGESRKPLLAPGTEAHSLFLRSWLLRFSEEHRHEEVAL
jgi:hypothetical protein